MFLEQDDSDKIQSSRETPVQGKLVSEISKINKQLADMLSPRQSGMSLITDKEIKDLKEKIHKAELNLNR